MIHNTMDLDRIQWKLECNKYRNVNEWEADFHLSHLNQKLKTAQKPAIDLNDLDFVEFELWHLGTESGGKTFYIAILVLTDNDIKRVDKWSRFFPVLPNFNKLHLNGNNVSNTPSFPEWPHLEVVWDNGSQKGRQTDQQQDGGRGWPVAAEGEGMGGETVGTRTTGTKMLISSMLFAFFISESTSLKALATRERPDG
jgi:hypothetical protein